MTTSTITASYADADGTLAIRAPAQGVSPGDTLRVSTRDGRVFHETVGKPLTIEGDTALYAMDRSRVLWSRKHGPGVLFGPADKLKPGTEIDVPRLDGTRSLEIVEAVLDLPAADGMVFATVRRRVIWRRIAGHQRYAVFGPADELKPGARITVYRRDGSSSMEVVERVLDAGAPEGQAFAAVVRHQAPRRPYVDDDHDDSFDRGDEALRDYWDDCEEPWEVFDMTEEEWENNVG